VQAKQKCRGIGASRDGDKHMLSAGEHTILPNGFSDPDFQVLLHFLLLSLSP
jgi:hypothetical protein